MDLLEIGARAAVYFLPFLFALCFHEFAHGLVAKWRGDNTATMMGRLTMNPLVHMDVMGTLLLPLAAIAFQWPLFFGWAKPVPVNSRNLKTPRTDLFWIALAGPLSNIFLAVVGALLMAISFRFFRQSHYISFIMTILDVFISINLTLAFFNLLPIHPLDGGKVLARFISPALDYKLEQNQMMNSVIIMIILISPIGRILFWPVAELHMILKSLAVGLM